jgi:hypothetical protein
MLNKFYQDKRNPEEGAYTVLGLMLFVGLLLPVFALVSDVAVITNASSQAHGMAYNIAYASANRGVDVNQLRQAGGVVMFRESLDGVSPDSYGQTQLRSAYQEIDDMSEAMGKAARLSGDTASTSMELKQMPAEPMYTGFGNRGNTTITNRSVGFVSVPLDPIDARIFTNQTLNSDFCNPSGAYQNTGDGIGQVSSIGSSQTTLCWVDGRALNDELEKDVENPTGSGPDAWAHYSSGAEAHLVVSRDLPFGGSWSSVKVGVAAFGRPCDTNIFSDIGRGLQAGDHCRY